MIPWPALTTEEWRRKLRLRESNDCHVPAGSPMGGQFCSWNPARGRILKGRRATKSGMRAASEHERKKLGIPPAYRDVKVATDPKAELRATAVTSKGKTVSYYSGAYLARQEAVKWSRVMALQHAMPGLWSRIEQITGGNPKNPGYQEAMTLRLIAQTGLRNGSGSSGEVESFGASSLRMSHVRANGDTVQLSFTGKSGVKQEHSLTDRVLANYVRQRRASGAVELFDHKADATLKYLKSLTSGKFKVHDLRTWHGTVLADAIVQRTVGAGLIPQNKKEFKALRKRVGLEVSSRLGNTASIALSTYIHPTVFKPVER